MRNQLYIIKLDSCENFSVYKSYVRLLSPDKQSHINGLRNNTSKRLSLLADVLIRYIASKFLNRKNKELWFDKNAYGKPYLVGFPEFHYNISHTKYMIAVGISDYPIGVDVERIQLAKLKIARRFFHEQELDYIFSHPRKIDKCFYEIWTKKEAYVKRDGRGMFLNFRAFNVMQDGINNIFETIEVNNYIVSICTKNNIRNEEVIKLYENQVLNLIKNL